MIKQLQDQTIDAEENYQKAQTELESVQVQLEYYTKETERLSVENELLKQQLQTAEEHRDRLINELQQDDEAHQHTEEELTAQLIDKDN